MCLDSLRYVRIQSGMGSVKITGEGVNAVRSVKNVNGM